MNACIFKFLNSIDTSLKAFYYLLSISFWEFWKLLTTRERLWNMFGSTHNISAVLTISGFHTEKKYIFLFFKIQTRNYYFLLGLNWRNISLCIFNFVFPTFLSRRRIISLHISLEHLGLSTLGSRMDGLEFSVKHGRRSKLGEKLCGFTNHC